MQIANIHSPLLNAEGHPTAILIEGVECSGKTTLIKYLRENVIAWDCKYLAHQPGQQFERFMYEYVVNKATIFNRGHFSEIVYSQLWNRAVPFQTHELQVLNEYVNRHFVLVICEANEQTLMDRYIARDYSQSPGVDDLSKIGDLFRAAIHSIDCIRYMSHGTEALVAVGEEINKRLR